MILIKAYGKTTIAVGSSLLMVFAMIINQSLVARTFGSYIMQLFDSNAASFWIPFLGVMLLIITFVINISGNKTVQRTALIMAITKVGGIAIFALVGLWVADFSFQSVIPAQTASDLSITSYLGAFAITTLAFAGFTTITNSGDEVKNPHKNIGRAIIISIIICTLIYLLVAFAVSANLSVSEIIAAKDFSLAEAARPSFGHYGVWFTVSIAIVATVSGLIANVFAVSRMSAMLTDMKLIPHKHFGMSGSIQKHMLVYTIVIAIILTIFFDLSRIASLGAIFYLFMDIVVHWGVLTRLRKDVNANPIIVSLAIIFDLVILGAFLWIKSSSDPFVVGLALVLMLIIFFGEHYFLKLKTIKK
jgi:amino acid transporter